MIAYFDTSAVVKLLIDEPGRELVEECWEAFPALVTSVTAYPEARSAIASAARAGRLRAARSTAAVRELWSLISEMSLVELDVELAHHAGDLADRFALRGYDAVHLATALRLDEGSTTVVTWDVDLARAAERAGLAVVTG